MDSERIKVENEILDKISGRVFLLQDIARKREVIFQVFMEVYNSSSACQRYIRKSNGLDLESFFREFFSYGIIEEFLGDPDVEDIMINYLSPIYLRKTKVGMVKTERNFSAQEDIDLLIKKLIVFSGRKKICNINNVELTDIKGRANIVYSPFGPQITITRAKEKPLSIVELIKSGTLNPQLAAQLWLYIEGLGVKSANLIISGGPGTGKTTLLNSLFSFMPENERVVIIEDTLELDTELEKNCSRLESDEETSLADLVKNSLRMRPDRIIVGEVRGREAQDLMTAMNIGKYCMGTLHASTARETIMRLQNEPMNIPETLVNLVDVFVIMRKYIVAGNAVRVIGELVETAGMEQRMVLLCSLWSYDLAKAEFQENAVSSIYRDRLATISGKSSKEIMTELKTRTAIFKKLLEKNILDIKLVTNLCRQYSLNPERTLKELGLKRED